MLILALLLLVLVAAGAILVYRKRNRSPGKTPMVAASRTPEFRGASIRCGQGSCAAVRRLQGKRYLPAEIPRLPVPGCDAPVCHCTYRRHADRRNDDDRRDIYGSLSASHFGTLKSNLKGHDLRTGQDRRAEGNNAANSPR